jgi:2'-5' RNA ligase
MSGKEFFANCHIGVVLPDRYHFQLGSVLAAVYQIDRRIDLVDPSDAHITLAYLAYKGHRPTDVLMGACLESAYLLRRRQLRVRGVDNVKSRNKRYIHFDAEDPRDLIGSYRKALAEQLNTSVPDGSIPPHMTFAKYGRDAIDEYYLPREEEVKTAADGIEWRIPVHSLRVTFDCNDEQGKRNFYKDVAI